MKKKILLTALAAAAIAVGAQAQVRYLKANQPYTFSGNSVTGTGTITYQWYRNGAPISGATSATYTMNANQAYGTDVEIKRGVVSSSCTYNVNYSNKFIITFVECMDINGVCWATTNVDAFQVFAPRPDINTSFYQWNRAKAWAGSVAGWNSNADNSSTWTINPCPDGWRLPTQLEFQALNNAGTTWVYLGVRGASVTGRFYGPNHATAAVCTLPNNMSGCIFLPAGGNLNYGNGQLSGAGTGGTYWSSTHVSSEVGYHLSFEENSSGGGNDHKAFGFNIRCVLN